MKEVAEFKTRSLLIEMSTRAGMEPANFEATLRATVVPKETTREQLAAFLLVCRDYHLNPILKEIYAFPSRAGGIQPIVSIDGWLNLMNSHPQMDGIEFEDTKDSTGAVTAIKARIFRKDRSRSIEVTEYMAECRRNTDVWKQWPTRMLRHKAAIQCARYAFGFGGIVEPDEFEREQMTGATLPRRASSKALLDEFAGGNRILEGKQSVAMTPAAGGTVGGVDALRASPADSQENPMPEFSAADAYAMGQQYCAEGRPMKPPEFMSEAHGEAFLAGWHDTEAERRGQAGGSAK